MKYRDRMRDEAHMSAKRLPEKPSKANMRRHVRLFAYWLRSISPRLKPEPIK